MKHDAEEIKLVTVSARVNEDAVRKFDAVCKRRYRTMAQELRRFVEEQAEQAEEKEAA